LNKIAKELLLILKKIHENKVIHQDIKPQNIMKDKYGRYYFIDFGLSKIISDKKSTRRNPGFIGTPRFASLTAH
jgi:serine/threonine protein kinase